MRKLIVVLHRAELGARLLAAPFRKALAAAGSTAVQVNLDDADVAPALRFGPGEPVTALVSIWTGGDPGDAVTAVAEAAGEPVPHAYRVTERVRLDPAAVPDGARADAFAQVALLRRPTSMTRDEYLEYWMVQHTPIAIRTQGTVCYIQNIVEEALTPSSPPIAGIVEEHFPMAALTDPHAFYGSHGDEAELRRRTSELMASVARFGADQGLDLVPTSRYSWTL
ncbi:EthD domain-containing protein [Cryptosporangium aurantiacum]|uniref:EthD domain-containing protein n=1 Tax=Cryptosporangium aurantiacum TaxID=134849 RepID=A0A1M7RPD2_9ACTN|nr:EthD domain-containing protein [Cryptosporangium aurantiacum]SHN48173.1 EthD domain-containing protein [Cryptosporangium aurantiacum]